MKKQGRDKIKYIGIGLLFLVAVILLSQGTLSGANGITSVSAADEDSELVRVGLEGLYYNKSSMTIRNTGIVIGYSIDNEYHREMSMNEGPFTLKPYMDSYSEVGSYSTYEDAQIAASEMVASGKSAYPLLNDLDKWSVAVCNEGEVDKYAVLLTDTSGEGIIYTAKSNVNGYPQITPISANSKGVYVVDMGERQYRGRIEIGRYKGVSSLKAVNIVTMEKYLYGVVPCEMVYTWHDEALKAQAVCARSYAYMAGYGGDSNITSPYKLCDTTSSQVYKGYGAECSSTNNAVDATCGELVYYNGSPVRTYYSSTSGGSTENVEDVWGTPYAYLRQVSDIYELKPELKPWIITLTEDNISDIMEKNGVDVGDVTDIRPFVTTASGRVYSVEIVGDTKQVITGSQLRKYFSLYSTKYKVIKYSDNPDYVSVLTGNGRYVVDIADSYIASGGFAVSKASDEIEQFVVMTADNLVNYPAKAPKDTDTYYIAGMGYGHGIGMSQSGARGMADAGFNYRDILKHYFTGVEIK